MMKNELKIAKSKTAVRPKRQIERWRRAGARGVMECKNFKRATGSSIRLANHSTHGFAQA
jgi:hypothetical protein